MSKIIYLMPPAHGHVNPTLPVVQELVQRGEQVIYYNTEEFRPQIERTGAVFRPYPIDGITSAEISKLIQDGNLARVSLLVFRKTEVLLPFVLEELKREQPDLVVFDALALWGKMAATLLNLRSVGSIPLFVFEGTQEAKMTSRAFLKLILNALPLLPGLFAARRRLIRRYGKAFPASPIFPVRGDLNIVFTARELNPDTPLIDDTFRFVGPSIDPATRDGDFPFDALGQQLVVYISLGTVHNLRTTFYHQCFEAFRDYPAQFILSVGKHTDSDALGTIPSNFIVRQSVPQLEVLQRADVFITHGGMNSIHEGLYYGALLIVYPHQIEQLMNGRIVEKHGAGIVIGERGRLTVTELRGALDKVLTEPSYHEATVKVRRILQDTGGYRQAADEIQAAISVLAH
ncbi:MAG TPA: macrolide family glycosyltransferase [Oceanobacillus sp.]|nr:macrolide family glycosyltransferase [Oceanobacillus sp.]